MDQPVFTLPPLPSAPSRILLFVAMHSEAEPIARALGLVGGRGTVAGAEIELLTPGTCAVTRVDKLGPVHAALALTRAIAARRPDLVVNMGTAGGFESQGLGIADLVVARDAMFHDARVELPGFDALVRAHTRLSPNDAQLAGIAARLSARTGLASSGSSLDATANELALFARTRTLAKDMELASLAVVCGEERLPLAALKGVTDLVDHHEPTHEVFVRNLKKTSDRIAAAAGSFIELVAGS